MPLSAPLLEIARDALLDHLDRGDARHALRLLLSALTQTLGRPCNLQAQGADGSTSWSEGATLEPNANAMTLTRLGATLGWLRVGGPADATLAHTLAPVMPALQLSLIHI